MRVLGIDASLRSSGVGVVEAEGGRFRAVAFATIRHPPHRPHSGCLRGIQQELDKLLAETRPDAAAIEGGFYFKNAKTAMVLGEVRGVVIAACAAAGVPVYEYSPRLVKQALTGSGAAQKDQVSRMVQSILGVEGPLQEDAADALAVAICHLNSQTNVAALRSEPI